MKSFVYSVLVVLLCITMSSCDGDYIIDTREVNYVKSKTPVNLREGPSMDAKVLARHNEDSRILWVKPYDDEWSQVCFENRDHGFMSNQFLDVRVEEYRREKTHRDDLVQEEQKLALIIYDAYENVHITILEGLLALIPIFLILFLWDNKKKKKLIHHLAMLLCGFVSTYLFAFAEIGNDCWLEYLPGFISKPIIFIALIFMVMFLFLNLNFVFSLDYMPKGRFLSFVLAGEPDDVPNEFLGENTKERFSDSSRHIMGNLILLALVMFCAYFIEHFTDFFIYLWIIWNVVIFVWYFVVGIMQREVKRVLFALLTWIAWIIPLLLCAAILGEALFIFLCVALLLDGGIAAGGDAISKAANPSKNVGIGYDERGREIRIEYRQGSCTGRDQYGNEWGRSNSSSSDWSKK